MSTACGASYLRSSHLHATLAAVEEGVLPGGGVALLRSIKALEKLRTANSDQKTGIDIVRKALSWPARQIAFNAGTGVYEDLVKAGVIDPTKVTRTALQNAASIAGLMLTTEAMIADIPEKKEATGGHSHGGGGMDGMY